MWQKLLNIARESSAGQEAAVGSGTRKHAAQVPHSPGKRVTFFGGGNGTGGAPSTGDNATGSFSYSNDMGKETTTLGDNKYNRGSLDVFSRLWAECVGDDTCRGFTDTSGSILGGGPGDGPDGGGGGAGGSGAGDGDNLYGRDGYDGSDIAVAGMDTRVALGGSPRLPQQHPSSLPVPGSPSSPWERLLLALLNRGVDASRVLTTHEYTLLKRELADWHRGQDRGDVGREEGTTAERLASAAVAIQPTGDRAAIAVAGLRPSMAAPLKAQSDGKKNKKTTDVAGNHGVGTANASRQVSFGGFDYPWVVVGDPSSSVIGNVQANEVESRTLPAESTAAAAAAGGAETAVKMAHLKTPMDLRKVALEAHDVSIRRVQRTAGLAPFFLF